MVAKPPSAAATKPHFVRQRLESRTAYAPCYGRRCLACGERPRHCAALRRSTTHPLLAPRALASA